MADKMAVMLTESVNNAAMGPYSKPRFTMSILQEIVGGSEELKNCAGNFNINYFIVHFKCNDKPELEEKGQNGATGQIINMGHNKYQSLQQIAHIFFFRY